MSIPGMTDEIRELRHERDIYREWWEAERAYYGQNNDENSFLAALRMSKAREAVKRLRGEL